jgi:hypothetical protein
LNPVQYYKLVKDDTCKAAVERVQASSGNSMKKETEEFLDSTGWPLAEDLDVKSAPDREFDPANVEDIILTQVPVLLYTVFWILYAFIF